MRPIHIMLIEDNEGDILLTTEAFEERALVNKITVIRDGEAAIELLGQPGGLTAGEIPDLILLDVNLPRKNGHEVLQFVKQSSQFRHIPVIMLTTSCSGKDIVESYQQQASRFISKPVDADDFSKVVTEIESFWTSVAHLPLTK